MIKKKIMAVFFISSIVACSAENNKSTNESDNSTTTQVKVEIVEEKVLIEEENIPVSDMKKEVEKVVGIKKDIEISKNNKTIEKPVEAEKIKPVETVKVIAYSPSHSAFDALLKKYVTASGSVNYNGFKTDKSKLIEYIGVLSKNAPTTSWTKNEKLAYWINLYNASTIQLILKNSIPKSIMDINDGKAWDIKFIKSGSKTLSLNQIENDIIRPTFKEPRIHFAVNCAAVSCPKILNGAFYPHILDKQLESATKKFINNKVKNSISNSSIQISSIFDWYAVDFGGKSNLINYFNKYSLVKINSSANVSFKEYNWNLNR